MTKEKPVPTPFGGTGNRFVAMCVDLLLVAFGSGLSAAALSELQPLNRSVVPLLALAYFAGMPLTPLEGTLGKWICRIRICDRQGRRLRPRAAVIRAGAMLAWWAAALWLMNAHAVGIFGRDIVLVGALLWLVPWVSIGFLARRESLFDLLAGSLVVRSRADEASVVSAPPVQKPGVLNVGMMIAGLLIAAWIPGIGLQAMHDMDRRGRVMYAYGETDALRRRIEAFHLEHRRWPTAADLGVAATPYRDGGGYRMNDDASIVISFSVLPELKGRSFTLRPAARPGGEGIEWQCRADPAFDRRYLPARCREP